MDKDDPAFPSDMRDSFEKKHRGLTVRLYIAAQIMAGMSSNPNLREECNDEVMAAISLSAADRLIAADKGKP